MVRGLPPTRFTGSALVRWLTRLADADGPDSRPAPAERLSQWLGWTDAIPLSAALNAPSRPGLPAAPSPDAPLPDASAWAPDPAAQAAQEESARLRAALARTIAEDFAPAAARRPRHADASRDASATPPEDPSRAFSRHRRTCQARQQAMETAIGAQRARLRDLLAARSPELARLAGVDEVMERVLAERERSLLASVPVLLERHFERLHRQAQVDPQATAPTTDQTEPPRGEPPSAPWQETFLQDMQDVLLAELDFRMQPVEGLLDALRTA